MPEATPEPLHPAVAALLERLAAIKATAPHHPDPRAPLAELIDALDAYFRTPD